ncbi:hypothetical protein HCU64_23325 [Methylobacterium sp. C25]|uniref:DNA-binding protein n=1 Tax=Methylobacterium sp. C25 TaxID=2721622 RepID=UPI001F48FCDC|nr:DNA-binding protein [Methylobacterium sp. C25]MCE4226678.1 hypothetical protein [Methylobacterium sp. C25]
MPHKWQVYETADRLLAAGDRVSLRNVIAGLRGGGSNRDVGPLLREWKVERSYRPALASKDLPERFQRGLAKAAAELWAVAQGEAARLLEEERVRLAAELCAADEILHEALARFDVAEAEAARLRVLLARSEGRASIETGGSPPEDRERSGIVLDGAHAF